MLPPVTLVCIPQPCHERWDAMPPTTAGRHCAACQQVVVDFTHKTDAEILAHLAGARRNSCGRFRADQLARPLQPAEPASRWRSWLASVLTVGGVLGSGRAAAQAGGQPYSAGPTPAASVAGAVSTPAAPTPAPLATAAPALPTGAGEPLVVRGKVVDRNNQGLPGVTVLLLGTTLGISTNEAGDFELTLPPTAAQDSLLFSYVGYGTRHLAIPASNPAPLVVQLQEDVQGMMGVVVVGGYYVRKPWPWHPRRLYQWSKYQLLRPFRSN